MSNHLFSALSRKLEPDPSRVFAVEPCGRATSYGDFFAGALRMATKLVDCGIEPGDRVALFADKSLAALQLYLGTVAAGGALLPINAASTIPEAEYILGDALPRVLVCPSRTAFQFDQVIERTGVASVLTLEQDGSGSLSDVASGGPASFEPVPCTPEHLASILYTSGTTGRPKGAMLFHGSLVSNYSTIKRLWHFSADDKLIHFLPTHHVHGLFVATNVALMSGCSLNFFPKFDPDAVIEALPYSTVMMGVPTHYTRLLARENLTREATRRMRLFVSGSAPLLASTHRQWEQRTGHRILERYGMSESNMIASNSYAGRRKPGSVGAPIPGVQIRIRMADGSLTNKPDQVGSLEVKSTGLFSGYWNMPDKTREDLSDDGWFKTGDVARIDDEGDLVLEGRACDLVISGGVNIYPKELEGEIDEMPGVGESAVIGVPHPDFGEAVVALVVRSGSDLVSAEAIRSWLDGRLSRYKLPKRVIFLDALPRNTMGKVQKSVLRRIHYDLFKE